MKWIAFLMFCLYQIVLAAHPGIGIVMDSKGNVFYTDLEHVWRIDPAGQVSRAVANVHSHELYLDPEDNLFGMHSWYNGEVLDTWGYFIWKRAPDGTVSKVVDNSEGFPENNLLVRDCYGNEFWTEGEVGEQRIHKRSPKGKVVSFDQLFEDVRWMHVAPGSEDLYLIDYTSVFHLAANGKLTMLSDDLAQKHVRMAFVGARHNLMGMWTDPDGALYVAVFGGKVVKKVSPSGQVSEVYRSPGKWSPTGGFLDAEENLWLLEYSTKNEAQVRKVSASGEEVIFSGR